MVVNTPHPHVDYILIHCVKHFGDGELSKHVFIFTGGPCVNVEQNKPKSRY